MRIFQRIILGLGIVFAAELLYLSLSFEAVSDFTYYSELLTQTNLNPLLQIMKTALLIGVLMIVLRLLQRKKTEPDRKTAALITAVLACYTLCVSLYLNHINNVGLYSDSIHIWNMTKFLSGVPGDAPDPYYWSCAPHQAGIAWVCSLIVRLFQIGPDDYAAFRVMNSFMAALLVIGMYLLTTAVCGKRSAGLLSAGFVALWPPTSLYTNLFYPTTVTLGLSVFVFWGLLVSLKKFGWRRWLGLGLSGCLLVFDNLLYQTTRIASVAGMMIVILSLAFDDRDTGKTEKFLLAAAFCLLVWGGYTVVERAVVSHVSAVCGIDLSQGIPVSAYVLMGLNWWPGITGGPGSFDATNFRFYDQFSGSTALADRAAVQEIMNRLTNYYFADARNLFVFEKKLVYEWCDPWFHGITNYLNYTGEGRSAALTAFCSSGILEHLDGFLMVVLTAVEGLSVAWMIHALKQVRRHCLSMVQVLPLIYFIGGFIFQFFWEAKPRYCMPFFVLLVPMAAEELIVLCGKMRRE